MVRSLSAIGAFLLPQVAGGLSIDYDQILAKLPGKTEGKFVWHQDMGYWPDPRDDK